MEDFMNHLMVNRIGFGLLFGSLILSPLVFAEKIERKQESVEIKADQLKQLEEMEEIKPVAEVKEEKTIIPEIPKVITRERLGPAEQLRLDELEQKRVSGKITETEYQLEKDSLFRDANIKF
jgi:hypothetical protein